MKEFPAGIKFKYTWRSYQQRVLDELDSHLEDNHLHVIAPPGSGKTILGLEVALRLNQPTLIFAPTIAIRNQWILRFRELFLQSEETPDWISRDIRNPKFLTVSTYQGLFAACTGRASSDDVEEAEEEPDAQELDPEIKFSSEAAHEIISRLQKQNIKTIIVDEAHHLKNAWWRSLDELKTHLKPTIVGLTATPPYDVTYSEWQRYQDLNGPVDAEISVPELVVEGNLCPHQDYVLLSRPTREENDKLVEYNQRIETLVAEIKGDPILRATLSALPIFTEPQHELDWIYSNLEQYSAILIFLNAIGVHISPQHLEVIGNSKLVIPTLDFEWMEILLKFYLFSKEKIIAGNDEHKELILNRLRRNGAIEHKSITFRNVEKRRKVLSSSLSKLTSIARIAAFEAEELGDSLRMVILTDYIRNEYLVNSAENKLVINKIGVLPIFEMLRRKETEAAHLGILTGSIVIIPTSAMPAFRESCMAHGVDQVSATELSYAPSYTQIKASEKLKNDIVHIITHLFETGQIRTLVGTKSLLGEGWDAPAINSLILASFVGSYVLSNQMRGRAIRSLSTDKNKTGNIWHLVCVDLGVTDGGTDLELLKRRFKAFVGVSYSNEPSIENGVDRLNMPLYFENEAHVEEFNQMIFSGARDRESLLNAWKEALEKGNMLIEEIKIPYPNGEGFERSKSFYSNRTLGYLLGILGSGLFAFGQSTVEIFLRNIKHVRSPQDVLWWLAAVGVIGIGLFGGLTIKSLRLYLKYRDISKDLEDLGLALLDTLTSLKQINTPRNQLDVVTSLDALGAAYCHLEGGTTFEKSLFIQALSEIVSEVDNPRYLVIRKHMFFNFKEQKDYHAVPDSIGRLKTMAQVFEKNWRQRVGKCELVFTRNIEGRKILLRSRLNTLATELSGNIHRVNKWK